MLTDSVVQYLVSKNWRNILVLQGPSEADAETAASLQRSVAFFGARVVDTRPFLLSNDPRAREEGNMALVTAGANYDVAYVIDNDGEFARAYAPYQATTPRPVVGASGLVPLAWHWSWERSGAPQVNDRFEDLHGRRMDDRDWAAWIAVRAVTQGALRSQSTEYQAMLDFILGERMNLDGAKGFPLSVRPWDHQIRQSIVLATGNAVIALAPIEGFLHQTNDLDTLGVDAPQSECRF
jgi:ABC transporter substrate binding protein (PQQ-dependent alcohol dehydrogenase system)